MRSRAMLRRTALAVLAAFSVAICVARAAAPDVAREARWAAEVVPQIVVGDAVWLTTAHHARVLALYARPAHATRNAVIVVHGMGVNPDWNLIGVLRTALADLGFATLSVQMPVLAADAPPEGYPDLFGDAGERLAAAVAWLRDNGYTRVGVVSHSLGSAMVDAWLAQSPRAGIDAWVPVGMQVDFSARPRVPLLDVVAEGDLPEALAHARTRARLLPTDGCSKSLEIADADHFFERAAARLAAAIAPFLARALRGACVA